MGCKEHCRQEFAVSLHHRKASERLRKFRRRHGQIKYLCIVDASSVDHADEVLPRENEDRNWAPASPASPAIPAGQQDIYSLNMFLKYRNIL